MQAHVTEPSLLYQYKTEDEPKRTYLYIQIGVKRNKLSLSIKRNSVLIEVLGQMVKKEQVAPVILTEEQLDSLHEQLLEAGMLPLEFDVLHQYCALVSCIQSEYPVADTVEEAIEYVESGAYNPCVLPESPFELFIDNTKRERVLELLDEL